MDIAVTSTWVGSVDADENIEWASAPKCMETLSGSLVPSLDVHWQLLFDLVINSLTMVSAHLSALALCLGFTSSVHGQQMQLVHYDVDSLGLSAQCAETLNSTVTCSDFLGYAGRDM